MAQRVVTALAVGIAVLATSQTTQAHPNDPIDGAITGGLVLAGIAAMLLPVEPNQRWQSNLLPFDEGTKQRFSYSAKNLSDLTLVTTITTPIAIQVATGIDRDSGRALLLYGEAMAGSFFLMSLTKYLVQRPRPYVYNEDERVKQYTATAGDDSMLSFYSGHASMTFTAAVSGSILFANRSDDLVSRSLVWGGETFMASLTATLRVRAGRHFPSDVIAGAVVGIGVGLAVPLLHADTRGYRPEPAEWASLSGGLVAGTLLGLLYPFDPTIPSVLRTPVVLGPAPHGAGLAVSGVF